MVGDPAVQLVVDGAVQGLSLLAGGLLQSRGELSLHLVLGRALAPDRPTGFHLKEYSTGELVRLFRQAGYSRFRLFFWSHGVLLRILTTPIVLLEAILQTLPRSWQRRLAHSYPLRRLLGNFIAER